jgi:hypothetical protein
VSERDVIDKMAEALLEAFEFFVARDEMNARFHLQAPSWSPLTDLCREAVEAWRGWKYHSVK